MGRILISMYLVFACGLSVACKPYPAPAGSEPARWASSDEAIELVPYVVLGTASFESDDLTGKRGFRFKVERWIKGNGPDVIYVRGPYYTRKSKAPYHSCMVEIPLDTPIVVMLNSVAQDGSVNGIHHFDFLKNNRLFVKEFWRPSEFGL
jgi:hypothetical protein